MSGKRKISLEMRWKSPLAAANIPLIGTSAAGTFATYSSANLHLFSSHYDFYKRKSETSLDIE